MEDIKKVLLIDDLVMINRTNMRLLSRKLAGCWEFFGAVTIDQAEEIMAHSIIDVIVSDWNMPKGGGCKVLEIAAFRGIPVIIYAANVDFHTPEERQKRSGAVAVIEKAHSKSADRLAWAIWEATR